MHFFTARRSVLSHPHCSLLSIAVETRAVCADGPGIVSRPLTSLLRRTVGIATSTSARGGSTRPNTAIGGFLCIRTDRYSCLHPPCAGRLLHATQRSERIQCGLPSPCRRCVARCRCMRCWNCSNIFRHSPRTQCFLFPR